MPLEFACISDPFTNDVCMRAIVTMCADNAAAIADACRSERDLACVLWAGYATGDTCMHLGLYRRESTGAFACVSRMRLPPGIVWQDYCIC